MPRDITPKKNAVRRSLRSSVTSQVIKVETPEETVQVVQASNVLDEQIEAKLNAKCSPRHGRVMRNSLIQETLCHDLFALIVQCCLWNQTRGTQARPVLEWILTKYPNPETMAQADVQELTNILQPIGLHNQRAKRLIAMAQAWLLNPPCKEKRYRKANYPAPGLGLDVRINEVLSIDDAREAYEISHLPGVGSYCLDSYRMFVRDRLRGIAEDWDSKQEGFEPEWKRVVPLDKELRAFLVWKWWQEGYDYNPLNGHRKKLQFED